MTGTKVFWLWRQVIYNLHLKPIQFTSWNHRHKLWNPFTFPLQLQMTWLIHYHLHIESILIFFFVTIESDYSEIDSKYIRENSCDNMSESSHSINRHGSPDNVITLRIIHRIVGHEKCENMQNTCTSTERTGNVHTIKFLMTYHSMDSS